VRSSRAFGASGPITSTSIRSIGPRTWTDIEEILGASPTSSGRGTPIGSGYRGRVAPRGATQAEAVEALAKFAEEGGVTITEQWIAFVLAHPAVTQAIIGSRTVTSPRERSRPSLTNQLATPDAKDPAETIPCVTPSDPRDPMP